MNFRDTMWKLIGTLVLTLMITIICCAAEAKPRMTIVFDIDQGFSDGPVQTGDLVGLGRVANDIKAFQTRYDTYALLACSEANRTRLDAALDLLSKAKVPFLLDVYSSDSMLVVRGNMPFDRSHGRALSIDDLNQYRRRYGRLFAGVRLMELFSLNYSLLACKLEGKTWLDRSRAFWPDDNFFQPKYVGDYLAFASRNKMFVIFSDWYWTFDHSWKFDTDTVHQADNEKSLEALTEKYPGTVVVMYANNEPDSKSERVESSWVDHFSSWREHGAKAIGLSDQAWIHTPETACDEGQLIAWASDAQARGTEFLETEPYFYWWQFPKPYQRNYDYTQDPAWSERGKATSRLRAFASAFDIVLPP